MNTRITIILILVAALFGLAKANSIDTLSFIRLNTRHGLPENKIRGLVELSDGKIGLVTAGYVSIFNGNNFKSYHTSSFPFLTLDDFNSYRHIFRDNKDRIWIKNDHELMAFDPTNRNGVNIDSLFSTISIPSKITNFFANSSGNYYFVNDQHDLYIWNEDGGLTLLDNISDTPYQRLERIDQEDGNIYLSFNSGLLVGVDISTGKRIYKGTAPIDFSQNKLKKGIVTLIAGDKLIISFNHNDVEKASVAALILSEKRWMSTINLEHLATSLGLLDHHDILVGGKALTQLSSDLSIIQHISDIPVNYDADHDTLTPEVSCIMNDSFGNIWVGTLEDGLLYHNKRKGYKITVNNEKFASKPSKRFISERAKTEAQRIAPRMTNATYEDSRGNLYIATVGGLIILDKDNLQIIKIDRYKGIDPDNVQSVIEDKNGDIWFTTPNSICRMKYLQSDSVGITSFNVLDGVELNGGDFRNCELRLDSLGFIHAGSSGGSCIFNPDDLTDTRLESFYKLGQSEEEKDTSAPMTYIWLIIVGAVIVSIGVIYLLRHRRSSQCKEPVKDQGSTDQITHKGIDIDKNKELLMNIDTNTLKNATDIQSPDEETLFLEKLRAAVEQHISDTDLSVQSLSEKMAMERSVLYRKMLTLTGMSPSEYIKEMKLKIASELLSSGSDISVSEVADKVGFSNPKYFSKVFKTHFGVSPKDYKTT